MSSKKRETGTVYRYRYTDMLLEFYFRTRYLKYMMSRRCPELMIILTGCEHHAALLFAHASNAWQPFAEWCSLHHACAR